MKEELRLKNLVTRYVANQCPADDLPELLAYLETRAGSQFLRELMDREAERSSAEADVPAMEPAISDRIFQRLLESTGAVEERPIRRIPFFSKRAVWRLAASLIGILLVVGLGVYRLGQPSPLTLHTDANQKRTVILPDGSRAILNGNTTLTYDTHWKEETARRVELEGEAFFDITHDAAHPFYVKTSRMEVRVLGTAFNVKSDQTQKVFETTLIRGQVTVRDLEAPTQLETVLQPDEKAIFGQQPSSAAVLPTKVEPDRSAYWNKGRLVFEDTPISIITDELEKWYGVKFKLSEASRNCRFYLNVGSETLPEVLELFEAISGAKSEINGKTITLNGSLCPKN